MPDFKTLLKNPLAYFKKQQTDDAELAPLKSRCDDDPSRGLTVGKLAQMLEDARDGNIMQQSALAQRIEEKDTHIFAELSKRKRALQVIPWQIKPPRNASKQELRNTEELAERFETFDGMFDLMFDMGDAIHKGFANIELTMAHEEKLWFPESCEYIQSTWFKVNPKNKNELRLNDNTPEGKELWPFGWIQHRHQSLNGYQGCNGLVRVLAWPYLFKNYSVRDFAEFLEIYGLPVRLGKYPSGASDKEKRTLLRALMSIGHNAGGIIPRGMEIDFHNAANGQSEPFMAMVEWAEKSQSKAILGQTLTAQADGKTATNALGNIHQDVMDTIIISDTKQIAATLNRDLMKPLAMINYLMPGNRAPQFEFITEEAEDIKLFSEALPALAQAGMQIPVDWTHERLQIPRAEEGEAVLFQQASATNAPPEQANQAQLKGLAALKAALKQDSQQDSQAKLDQALDALSEGQQAEEYSQFLQPLIDALDTSPEQAAIVLAESYPELNEEALAERLARLMFVSEIWGELYG